MGEWFEILTLPLSSYVTLGKALHYSAPQFSRLCNLRLLGINSIINGKCLEQCLQCPVNITNIAFRVYCALN